ncbi:MAG: phenylalanine--tRNA ligase subunit beta [Candidatus Aminicenantes bacterium]|nr:phenylalanine--tRNA ligase subunit beta [Candidatus Aminicenantes bacterium]
MKISLNWLREYVDIEMPRNELLDRLTMIGLICEKWTETPDGDTVFDIETYANRPDTLGHLGIAREISAMTGFPLKERIHPVVELPIPTSEIVEVQVLDEDLCPRYTGFVVKGVKIGPSPENLRKKIEAMGLKPINNVVDASNAVLFATGQPIHMFDLEKVAGPRVVVRRAKKGEALRTLDGKNAALGPDMLVIADEKRPVAVAGVIGGEESGITEATRDVFIESAVFDPASIRRTRKALEIQTDACYRFERGADIGFAPEAAAMAASLLCSFGGRVSKGLVDIYPKPRKAKELVLRSLRTADLLGVAVPDAFIEKTLVALGFSVKPSAQGSWRVLVPSFRVDIEREADLIEEIARFFGYDRIPAVVASLGILDPVASDRLQIGRLSQQFFHFGFDEVVNASFADPDKETVLGTGRRPVTLRNPFSVHAAILRTTLLGGLLVNLRHNQNHGTEAVHIFEIGEVFSWADESRHVEELTLGLLSAGPLGLPQWSRPPAAANFHHLKGSLESALGALRYAMLVYEPAEHPSFEEGSALAVLYKGERIGIMGRVRDAICETYGAAGPAFAVEIALGVLLEKKAGTFAYEPSPKVPAVVRDLSFFVARDVSYQDIKSAVERAAVKFLESFDVIDRYAGPNNPPGQTSLSMRFVYRNPQATLLAEEADKSEQKILKTLKAAFKIELRKGGGA